MTVPTPTASRQAVRARLRDALYRQGSASGRLPRKERRALARALAAKAWKERVPA
jgi:hypothetical protein